VKQPVPLIERPTGNRTLDAESVTSATFVARLPELRRWQAKRLARTYADLDTNPRFSKAVRFFMSDLYGAQDFTERDRQLLRAARYLRRALPRAALEVLERAIELQVLTAQLDQAMVGALPIGPITSAGYGQAYRVVGNRAGRAQQIALIVAIGAALVQLIGRGRIGLLLRACHLWAHAAGFGVLQDFLERGYAAFRDIRGADPLLEAIMARETQLMQSLFAGDDSLLDQAPMPLGVFNE